MPLSPDPEHSGFIDQFSRVSADYARFRPRYPRELFAWIASLADRHALAWDCATGNGQAAIGLAEHFAHVEATDASAEQLRHAMPHPRIAYRQAQADASGLERASADVVTVAQALHWLPHDRFYAEVKRVLAPGGAFVAWGYHLPGIGVPAVDEAMRHFHDHVVGPYWRPERRYVVERLRTLPFPFAEIDSPTTFEVHQPLALATFGDLLRTQSATERYRDMKGEDPVPAFEAQVVHAWGGRDAVRDVVWPIFIRAGRLGVRPR
jgi:SAM-dependent methyltransferase